MTDEEKTKPKEGEAAAVQDFALICLVMLVRLHNLATRRITIARSIL